VCAQIPRVETRTRFVILRHRAERSRRSNTAHFAALALPGCQILDYGVRDAPFDDAQLPTGVGTFVLFPDEHAPPPGPLPERLIVLDGSWSQARHMRQRIVALRGLPLYALAAPSSLRPRLRHSPHEGRMSTLEAIAHAVGALEGPSLASPLLQLHDAIVQACLPSPR
jgi:DTW domain-containing protein YfiP